MTYRMDDNEMHTSWGPFLPIKMTRLMLDLWRSLRKGRLMSVGYNFSGLDNEHARDIQRHISVPDDGYR